MRGEIDKAEFEERKRDLGGSIANSGAESRFENIGLQVQWVALVFRTP
jgi:hypothetical protein